MARHTQNARDYLDRRTVIIGAVNSGKTRRTRTITDVLDKAGYAPQMVILDLAPEPVAGIGGKMAVGGRHEILYLSCPVTAPRLSGRNATHMQALAEQNARDIEPLLARALSARRSILVVNDATLYLQTGSLERFWALVTAHPTAVINAYYGHSFSPAPFTQIERAHVETLIQRCDQVIRLRPAKKEQPQ